MQYEIPWVSSVVSRTENKMNEARFQIIDLNYKP